MQHAKGMTRIANDGLLEDREHITALYLIGRGV